ncbi:MAG: nicotinamide mononucleotide transporter family protein [Flavobacteriales bacterium]|jgi:nicotinamide mononucleotide transporter|nr:nicotinamide mononucleotide transporter family protein [Flavobacteriales bacterium]
MKNWVRKWVNSPFLDLFGAILVLVITLVKGYHKTIYFNGEISSTRSLEFWWEAVLSGAYPLGLLATVGAVFSLLTTRLVGRQNNKGNIISIFTTINSGLNDFLLGNRSAIITYPFSFLAHILASYRWVKGIRIKKPDRFFYFINVFGLFLGYALVYLGFWLFDDSNFLETKAMLFHSIAISFGLSINGNFSNVFKYQDTFLSWIAYNIIQLIKNGLQGNIPNVAKYIFYLFNSIFTFTDWKMNGDRKDR